MRTFLANLFCICSVLDLQAAGAPLPPGQIVSWDKFGDTSSLLTAGWQYCAAIGGATGSVVTVRYVGPTLPPGYHQPVFFSSQTGEALLASSVTNHNCYLNGRLYRVDVAWQALYISPSTSLGTNVFTPESALEFAKRAFIAEHGDPGPYPLHDSEYGSAFESDTNAFVRRASAGRGPGGTGVLLDLGPPIAQDLGAIDAKYFQLSRTGVAIAPQGANLQVSFECYGAYRREGKMIKGMIVLDQNLNVLSMAITDTGK